MAQDSATAASAQSREMADQIRPKLPKLATLLDQAEEEVLACSETVITYRALTTECVLVTNIALKFERTEGLRFEDRTAS